MEKNSTTAKEAACYIIGRVLHNEAIGCIVRTPESVTDLIDLFDMNAYYCEAHEEIFGTSMLKDLSYDSVEFQNVITWCSMINTYIDAILQAFNRK